MYSALDIAKWFIARNQLEKENYETDSENYEVYEDLTHLKLQKLLYFAQGIYLAINEKPLFKEKIYAWQHGPVVPEVYGEYKKFGRDNIKLSKTEIGDVFEKIELDGNVISELEAAYDKYSAYTAWHLREETHKDGTPWKIIVKADGSGLDNEIPNELIMDYFKREIVG